LTTHYNVTIEANLYNLLEKNLELKGLQGPLGKVGKSNGNQGGGLVAQ
jgi:hypothetical protein